MRLICVLMVIFYHTVQADGEGKTETQDGPVSKETASSKMIMPATPASVAGKLVGPVISSGMTTALELRKPLAVHSKENLTSAPQPCAAVPPEAWLQVWSDNGSF